MGARRTTDNHRRHPIRVNKKISRRQTLKLAMRRANREILFSSGIERCSFNEGESTNHKAGTDSENIINSFLSIVIGISLAHSRERGQKIDSVLHR